ncbi:orphan G-protein coupled receptor 45 [Elysia marginata]|uniref:Orphan G-protein coupled receptor 45 n=1 Tax=Elysia marginata TaxID=1093978 RepID=A0AAV4HMR8_9GAST|nr:orphan G-protein coupled receptor 45 [Elysia marginata]
MESVDSLWTNQFVGTSLSILLNSSFLTTRSPTTTTVLSTLVTTNFGVGPLPRQDVKSNEMASALNYNFSTTLLISNPLSSGLTGKDILADLASNPNSSATLESVSTSGDIYDPVDDGNTSAMEEVLKATVNGLNTYAVPIICVLGIIGDVTSFLVFVISSFRYHPCSQYLAALAFVDTMFLLSQDFVCITIDDNYMLKSKRDNVLEYPKLRPCINVLINVHCSLGKGGLDSSVGRRLAPWPRGRGFEPQPSTVRAPTCQYNVTG